MALPEFTFDSVVVNRQDLPLEAFQNTVNQLNQRFDQGLSNISNFDRAQSAIQSAPTDRDREELSGILSNFNSEFDRIKNEGDFENQVVATQRLNNQFNSEVTPIIQRKQAFDQLEDRVLADKNITDKNRALAAIRQTESLNPTINRLENGRLVNTFDEGNFNFLFTPDVNLGDKINRYLQGAKADITTLSPKLRDLKNAEGQTIGQLIENNQIKSLSEEQVRAIADNFLDSDVEVQAFKEKERILGDIGLEDNFNSQLNSALEAATGKFAFRESRRSFSQPFDINNLGGGSGKKESNAIISSSRTSADLVSNAKDYRTLASQIKQAELSDNQELADRLKEVRDSFNSVALSSLNEDEKKIYNAISDMELLPGSNELKGIGLSSGRGTEASEEQIQKTKELQDVINNLGLADKYSIDAAGNQVNGKTPIGKILRKANKLIDKTIEDTPVISRDYLTFVGRESGEGKGTLGATEKLLNEDKDKQNFSVIKAFTKDNKSDFLTFINDKYKDKEIQDKDINYDDVELSQTNGISIDGFPMITANIFGDDKEGRRRKLGEELITKGDAGWPDYINTAKGLLESSLEEDRLQGNLMLMKAEPIRGERIGAFVARKNLASLNRGIKREIELGEVKGKIEQIYQDDKPTGTYTFTFPSGKSTIITSEDDLVAKLYRANR